MAQADGVVANGTGSAVRSDINNQYAALWSNHSGSTEPSSGKVAYQLWADTNSGYLKIRNAANNAWIQLFKLDGTDICRLTGSTNNQITTVTGANAIQGESKLTFDGDTLKFTHDAVTGFDSNSQDFLVIENGDSDTYINIATETNRDSGILFSDGVRARGYYNYNHNSDYASIGTAGSERFRIDSDGNIWLNGNGSYNTDRQVFNADGTSGLVEAGNELNIFQNKSSSGGLYIGYKDIANGGTITDYHFYTGEGNDTKANISCASLTVAAGGGINFAAQTATSATGASTSSELFDHYEEGTFLPFLEGSGGSGSTITYQGSDNRRGYYVRIGKVVTVWCLVGWQGITSGWTGDIQIGGLPFAHDATAHSNPNGAAQSVGTFYCQNLTLPKGDNGQVAAYLYGGYTTKPKFIQAASNENLEMVSISAGDNMTAGVIKYIQFEITYPVA